jgi:membrane protein implicated in regulation of membrane protease activity
MMRRRPPIKPAVYLRYGLLCAIELIVVVLLLLVVQQWVAFPRWLFWTIVAGWLVKDGVLFPFVWQAYDPDAPGAHVRGDMIGERGMVQERLDPSGYVRVRGERWRAEREGDGPPIEARCRVRVERREGLTLFVVPEDKEGLEGAGKEQRG